MESEHTAETGHTSRWEWQVAEGSVVAHVLDASKGWARRPDPGWRSGPRALCKRYPQRNREAPWFSLPVEQLTKETRIGYRLVRCQDCMDRLSDMAISPGQPTPPVQAEAGRLPTEDDFIVGAGRVLRDRGVVCSNSDVGRVYDWLRANLTTRASEPEDLDSHDDPPRRPLGPRNDG